MNSFSFVQKIVPQNSLQLTRVLLPNQKRKTNKLENNVKYCFNSSGGHKSIEPTDPSA